MDKSVQPISIDEALILMTEKIIDIEQVMNSIRIKDAKYSKEFWEEIQNALITLAVIKALGIGKKSEFYLGVIRKVVIELRTAESKGW